MSSSTPINQNKNSLYPKCWDDDVRMNVLFSPFRPKSVNPENYESKLNFWKRMIKNYCELNGNAQFNKQELLINFQRNERSPYGLDHVLDDMQKNSEIKLLTNFNDDIDDGWSIWILKTFLKKPIVWGVQKTIGMNIDNNTINNVEFIYMDVLQRQSSEYLNYLQNLNKNIIRYDELLNNNIDKMNLNYDGRILCLRYLHYLKKIYIEYKIDNGKRVINVIKVPKGDLIASPLTDFEWTLFNLENTQRILDKCIENLEIDMKNSEESARNYIRQGSKSLAKISLKKKHMIEKNLEKRIVARDNIHSLITSLEETQHNGIVLNAIKMGSDTLKTLFKKSDLDLDNVDKIILEVRETLDMTEDIQNTVAEPIINDAIDDSILEKELDEILSTSVDKETIINEEQKESVKENNKNHDDDDEELLKQLEELNVDDLSPLKDTASSSISSPR